MRAFVVTCQIRRAAGGFSDQVNRSEGNSAMERMLVAVFDREERTHEALRALEDLNEQGVIAIYADAVVAKTLDGATTVVNARYGDPDGTMGGTAIGSLIGMLGGPVALAIGAATGFVIGVTTDFAKARVDQHFVADVVRALEPGKAAVVAEIDEEPTDPVDARMRALGGRVLRRDVSEVVDTESERKIAAIENDLNRAKDRHHPRHAD
jgi:uncharacterized membrane protein